MLENYLKTGQIPEKVNLFKENFLIEKELLLVEEGIKNFFSALNFELKIFGVVQTFYFVNKDRGISLVNVSYTKIEKEIVRVTMEIY